MNILSIETSCDETAVSVVSVVGDFPYATYSIVGNALFSQVDIHRDFGGVFPALAKREHAATITAMLSKALAEAEQETEPAEEMRAEHIEQLQTLLYREPGLADQLITFHKKHGVSPIDLIAVTAGPGLEPALWVGVNFAKALALLWNVPVVPTNHMEGHVLASIFDVEDDGKLAPIAFPALSLLISGGHTELVLMHTWTQYEKVGQTRDDAVGEAFDKVTRLLNLPYPGGPEIGKLAALARKANLPVYADLPSPMLNSGDLDFSFSGLKTAVRYAIQDKELSETDKQALARDFEDVVTNVLFRKTAAAVDMYGIANIIVGGGVSASQHIRQEFNKRFLETYPDVTVYFPMPGLSTDNSIMIALAGHAKADRALSPAAALESIRADGNKSLA